MSDKSRSTSAFLLKYLQMLFTLIPQLVQEKRKVDYCSISMSASMIVWSRWLYIALVQLSMSKYVGIFFFALQVCQVKESNLIWIQEQ